MAQLLGFVLLVGGIALATHSFLPLLIGGALLLVVPEIASAVRRGDKAAKR